MKYRWFVFILIFCIACQQQEEEEQISEPNLQAGEDNEQEEENSEVISEETSNEAFEEITEEVDYTNVDSSEVYKIEVIADNLRIPWSIALTDDSILMTEREGRMIAVDRSDGEAQTMEVETSDPIVHAGEGGLLGLALASDYKDTGDIFIYYTYETEEGLMNKVAKAVLEGDVWQETEVVLGEIPGDPIHNGGRIAFGPDGYLYVTAGDAGVPDLSQDTDSLAGSILRMTSDGDIPEDNPFDDSYLYSFGHRNPQGLAWNSSDQLFSAEHGPNAQDEINQILAGENYGWPLVSGDGSADHLTSPFVHSGSETWAPSGIEFWRDTLFIAGLRGEHIYIMDEEEQVVHEFLSGLGRVRDLNSEGLELYLITNNTDGRGSPAETDDRLIRVTFSEE